MKPDALDAALQTAQDPSYWASLGSDLSMEDSREATDPLRPELVARLQTTGYVQVPDVVSGAQRATALRAVATVEAAGWLPTFAFLYDAPWQLARLGAVRQVVSSLLDAGYRQLPDFWAYHVRGGERGYRPHREVSREEMLAPDGMPRAITVWMALTDATLDNGCIYVVPRDLELQGLDPAEYGTDPTALIPYLLHRTRALPVTAGSLLVWNHLVLHWGSFSSPQTAVSRRSISCEFIRGDVDPSIHPHSILPADLLPHPPVTLPVDGPLPSFSARLFFVARNIRNYLGRGNDDPYQQMATALLHGLVGSV